MVGSSASATVSITVYVPWATSLLLLDEVLDFSKDVDELPTESDAALDAEDALEAATAEPAARDNNTLQTTAIRG
jgi:predicted hotdog family 3-hydroxylacyl-ACP dehydratase